MKKSSADNGPEKGNLEEVFRHGLGQGEVTPRGDLWGKIDQQLDQQQTAGKYKRRAGYLALLSAFLLLLIGSVALYRFLPSAGSGAVITDAGVAAEADQTAAAVEPATPSGLQNQVTVPSETKSGIAADKSIAANSADRSIQNGVASGQKSSIENTLNASLSTQRKQAAGAKNSTIADKNSQTNDKLLEIAGSVAKSKSVTAAGIRSGKKTVRKAGSEATESSQTTLAGNNSGADISSGAKATGAGNETGKSTVIPPALAAKSTDVNVAEPVRNKATANPESPAGTTGALNTANATEAKNTDAAGQTITNVNNAIAKPDSAKQELAVNTPIADSVTALPAIAIPAAGPRWVFSASYASYQFEQGLVISPEVPKTSQPIKNVDITRYQEAAQEFNELTKASNSYRVELRAGYWLKDRWRLESGVSYANNKSVTQSTYIVQSFVRDANGNMQIADESSVLEPLVNNVQRDSVAVSKGPGYETTYQYQFLAVPVRLIYQSDTDGWHWFASGGVSGGRLLSSSVESSRDKGNKEHLGSAKAFRKWQASGLFSFGLGYQINNRFSLQAGPDLTYSVNSLLGSKRSGVKQKNPYTVGISGGVSFTIR